MKVKDLIAKLQERGPEEVVGFMRLNGFSEENEMIEVSEVRGVERGDIGFAAQVVQVMLGPRPWE